MQIYTLRRCIKTGASIRHSFGARTFFINLNYYINKADWLVFLASVYIVRNYITLGVINWTSFQVLYTYVYTTQLIVFNNKLLITKNPFLILKFILYIISSCRAVCVNEVILHSQWERPQANCLADFTRVTMLTLHNLYLYIFLQRAAFSFLSFVVVVAKKKKTPSSASYIPRDEFVEMLIKKLFNINFFI